MIYGRFDRNRNKSPNPLAAREGGISRPRGYPGKAASRRRLSGLLPGKLAASSLPGNLPGKFSRGSGEFFRESGKNPGEFPVKLPVNLPG